MANVTTQVIERHMIRGIETVFSPITVAQMSDDEVYRIACETAQLQRKREMLAEKAKVLQNGQEIMRRIIRNVPG